MLVLVGYSIVKASPPLLLLLARPIYSLCHVAKCSLWSVKLDKCWSLIMRVLHCSAHIIKYINNLDVAGQYIIIIVIIYSYLSRDIHTDLSVFLQGALTKYIIECVDHEVMWHCEYQEEQSST